MVQGGHGKLGKAKSTTIKKASKGAQRRKTVKAAKSTRKGGSGGSTVVENNPGIVAATKAINRKNERIIAAKACTGGTRFFLKDIAEKGEEGGMDDVLAWACLCVWPAAAWG
jgi:hypothetical protein